MSKEKYPEENEANHILAQRGKIISNFAHIDREFDEYVHSS
jgi:hypothetical protein